MVNCRRDRVLAGTYFFTVTLADRHSDALTRHIDALRASWATAKARVPHDVVAVAVMPDHVHALITMRDPAGDYSRLWQDIKKGFTRRIPPAPGSPSPWQARFWEHTIRDDADLQHHADYIHINPMKHGLVGRVADWPHSSFHDHVRRGLLPTDWAGESTKAGNFGERSPSSDP